MAKYQPIEMAPKDGTWIKARGHDFGDTTRKKHTVIAFYEDGNWNEVGSEGSLLYYLKEWAPLATTEPTLAVSE